MTGCKWAQGRGVHSVGFVKGGGRGVHSVGFVNEGGRVHSVGFVKGGAFIKCGIWTGDAPR